MNEIVTIVGSWESRNVFVDGKLLDPTVSQKVYNHSPDGHGWGYGGSAPAQTALSILLTKFDKAIAVQHHQDFKWDVVARLPQSDFKIEVDLNKWMESHIRILGA